MSHPRNKRLPLLLVFAALACPAGSLAQSPVDDAQAQAQAARDAYHSLDLDQAQEQARAAVDTCERGGCPAPDMARYYVLQGMVEYAATQDRDRARAMFRQAVHTDNAVELDPELATPDLQAILVDAREDVAIDGTLSPEEVAARHGDDTPRLHEGGTCHQDEQCSAGLICEGNICVSGERPEVEEPWQRFFLEVGFNMAAATASDQMTPADAPVLTFNGTVPTGVERFDPQMDDDASNDSYYVGGQNGCNAPVPTDEATTDNYCVRVTSGLFVFAPGIHVGLGLWFTERLGVSLRARIGIGHGGGSLSFIQLGARFHFRVVVPKPDGLHISLFLGAAYGQIQVRPKQVDADRIWATTGPIGIDLGMNLGYRFTPNVGIFVQPGVYTLLPDFSLGLSATVGLDLAIGSVGGPPPPPPEPEPEDDDRDGDRILNHNDACPEEGEDVDGYEDEDGCPELDNDADGLVDAADACPREAEDMDGYEDSDGCPERDNDGDGVADVDDACPNEIGVGIARGCPEPDRDGDGVVDRMDNCPEEAGPRENHGCLEEQFVEIQEDRLVITQIIYFRTNRDVIEDRSFPLLAQIANVLNSHPEITRISIEGHTDSRGRARNNLTLSQRRARSVMNHLMTTGGVDASRLSSEGYGSTRPVVENATTEEEHAQNRRVEFVIHHD